MTSKEILENNKLIAEFMGLVFVKDCIQNAATFSYREGFLESSKVNVWVLNPIEKFFEIKKFGNWVDIDYYDNVKPYDKWYYENDLKYNESWDWLIPVVEKIEQPDYDYFVHILGNGCFITTNKPELYRNGENTIVESIVIHDSKIKSVYMAVVEFIKYYNQL